jgi:hypothetical protein
VVAVNDDTEAVNHVAEHVATAWPPDVMSPPTETTEAVAARTLWPPLPVLVILKTTDAVVPVGYSVPVDGPVWLTVKPEAEPTVTLPVPAPVLVK